MPHLRRRRAGLPQTGGGIALGPTSRKRPRADGAWRRIAALALCLAFVAGAAARAAPVDLALVLAVDVSDSIDGGEAKLQREGYMAAIQHPRILEAIKRGTHGRIAVAYFEWADAGKQSLIVDWMVIADAESARRFADRLRPAPLLEGHFTSISSALGFATDLIARNEFETERRIIDISGDGKNNNGPPIEEARDKALEQDITINGLPILNADALRTRGTPPQFVDRYYREKVIGGEGAFVVVAETPGDFEEAISRKLLREIAGSPADTSVARRPDAR